MSIQPPNGILDITGATLRVSKMEFSNVTGFDTVLNNVARNTVLHVDTTEYTANVAYAVKPPNMFMAQFDLELSAGGTGTPCNFNYYNDSNLGTSFNGYNLSFNDTSIILTYDGGSALHTATLSSSLNNGVYRKVKVLFDRDTTLVSINGENVFRFKDILRPRTYDTSTTGYIRWWHNSPVARKIKNLKVSNGEKWAQEYDSGGLSSNISYTHGLVGVGTSVPEYTLDVAGDIRASGNLIVNGSNTLINTTSLAIEDNVIECGKGNSSAAKDLGFLMVRNDGSSTTNSNVAMFWDESTDALTFGFSDSGPTATTLTPNTTKTLNSYFVGNLGVGTPTPDTKLTISMGNITTSAEMFKIHAQYDSANNGFLIVEENNHTPGNNDWTGYGTRIQKKVDSTDQGYIEFNPVGGQYSTAFGMGGTEYMRIEYPDGHVGIGTANPLQPLNVKGNGQNPVIYMTDPTNNRYASGMGTHNVTNVGQRLDFYTGDSGANDTSLSSSHIRMSIDANGKVGIGTTSPDSIFHTHSGTGADEVWVDEWKHSFDANWNFRLSQRHDHGVNVEYGFKQRYNTTEYSPITFRGSTMELSGNVGVGTANPGEKFHLHENLSTSGHQICARIGGTASSTYSTLVFGSKEGRPHIGGHKGDYGAWADLSFQNDLMVLKQSNMSAGIGTDNPYRRLHIKEGTWDATGAPLWIVKNNSAGVGLTMRRTETSNEAGSVYFRYLYDGSLGATNHMCFHVMQNTTNAEPHAAASPHMTIRHDGHVGIGTNQPKSTLHIQDSSANCLYVAGNNSGNPTGGMTHTTQFMQGFRIHQCDGTNSSTAGDAGWGTSAVNAKQNGITFTQGAGNPNIGSSSYYWTIGQIDSVSHGQSNFGFSWQGKRTAWINKTNNNNELDFTGQHRSYVSGVPFSKYNEYEGLIVSANKNEYYDIDENATTGLDAIQISQSLPLVSVSNVAMDKACFGVISGVEDPDTREYSQGRFVSVADKIDGDSRAFINSVGEGAIWVTNINGSLESGDYITTSNIAGYGTKQDDDILHNYTVAKITMDCDFAPATRPVRRLVKKLANVNYWVKTDYLDVELEEYSNLAEENRRMVTTKLFSNAEQNTIITPADYSNLESNVQTTYSEIETVRYQRIELYESSVEEEGWTQKVREESVNALDEHGQLQWEDHPTETEKAYKIRYLDADGKITTEANKVYTAAFVGCTYHCG